jgi:hypothetical protein
MLGNTISGAAMLNQERGSARPLGYNLSRPHGLDRRKSRRAKKVSLFPGVRDAP